MIKPFYKLIHDKKAEIRMLPMLVFCVCYIGIFGLLMSALPVMAPNLLYGGKEYTPFTIPAFFSKEDIEVIKYFENATIDYGDIMEWFDFNPDINVKLWSDWKYPILTPKIRLNFVVWQWLIWQSSEPMFFQKNGSTPKIEYLSKNDLIEAWNTDFNASIFNQVKTESGAITVKCWFTDTNATRNNIGNAWDNGHINLNIGFGLDDVTTSYNMWNILSILLTFSRPEVFGASGTVALLLNAIIAIPFYLCVAFLLFYFATALIPFIKGV